MLAESEEFNKYYYLVDFAVKWAAIILGPWGFCDSDDYRSMGGIGLLNALRNRDPNMERGQFISYAKRKISGAILDELRKLNHHRNGKNLQFLYIEEVAYFEPDDIYSSKSERWAFPEALVTTDERAIEQFEAWEIIRPYLNGRSPLDEKEKKVIRLRYRKGMDFKNIGASFGLTESRAHQIHKIAIMKLKRATGFLENYE